MGREVVVAVTDGRLDFGPWEQIFCAESDGRRRAREASFWHIAPCDSLPPTIVDPGTEKKGGSCAQR